MAEEFRFFARTGVYVVVAGVVYWLVSSEASGTVLLAALLFAIVAFIGVAIVSARSHGDQGAGGGPLGWLDRAIGFRERVDRPGPLEGGPEVVPLSSAWPVVTAAAVVVLGLGLIFGTWLLVPAFVLLFIGGWGWLTQLDDVDVGGDHR